MTSDAVLYSASDAIGVITMNRPDNRNSMTPEMLEAFVDTTGLDEITLDFSALRSPQGAR